MPIRIPTGPIHLHRDGKVIIPRIGEKFDFTSKEIEAINKSNPKALKHVIVADAPKDQPSAKAAG